MTHLLLSLQREARHLLEQLQPRTIARVCMDQDESFAVEMHRAAQAALHALDLTMTPSVQLQTADEHLMACEQVGTADALDYIQGLRRTLSRIATASNDLTMRREMVETPRSIRTQVVWLPGFGQHLLNLRGLAEANLSFIEEASDHQSLHAVLVQRATGLPHSPTHAGHVAQIGARMDLEPETSFQSYLELVPEIVGALPIAEQASARSEWFAFFAGWRAFQERLRP